MEVMAAIDLMEGRCVRLFQGNYERKTGYERDPLEQAEAFQGAGFDRLHLIDLEGARSGAGANRPVIRRIVEQARIPVQVGGGIRTGRDVAELLDWGVNFLILGTAALEAPRKVEAWIAQWGPQRFMMSLDVRRGILQSRGWLQESRIGLGEALERLRSWEIQQLICTDVERDGTLEQPDYETYARLRARLPQGAQLVAAGGVCRGEHIARLSRLGVHGVVVGRALYEGEEPWEALLRAG